MRKSPATKRMSPQPRVLERSMYFPSNINTSSNTTTTTTTTNSNNNSNNTNSNDNINAQ